MEKELSDACTVFTRFIVLKERHQKGTLGAGGDLRGNKQPRPDNVWSNMWKHMSDASKKKAQQRWTIEKAKLQQC